MIIPKIKRSTVEIKEKKENRIKKERKNIEIAQNVKEKEKLTKKIKDERIVNHVVQCSDARIITSCPKVKGIQNR